MSLVTLTSSDTQEVHLGEENSLIVIEVFLIDRPIKARKAVGCDEIRPVTLKAFNRGAL